MFFSSLVTPNFIIGVRENFFGNHKTVGVTRKPRVPPPNWNATNEKNNDTKPIVFSVSVSFCVFRVQQSRVRQQLAVILISTTKGHGSHFSKIYPYIYHLLLFSHLLELNTALWRFVCIGLGRTSANCIVVRVRVCQSRARVRFALRSFIFSFRTLY